MDFEIWILVLGILGLILLTVYLHSKDDLPEKIPKLQKEARKIRLLKQGLANLPVVSENHLEVVSAPLIYDCDRHQLVSLVSLSRDVFHGDQEDVYKGLVSKWCLLLENEYIVAVSTGWSLDIIFTTRPTLLGGNVLRVVRIKENIWRTYLWAGGKEDGYGDFKFVVAKLMKKPKLWLDYLEKQRKFNQPK